MDRVSNEISPGLERLTVPDVSDYFVQMHQLSKKSSTKNDEGGAAFLRFHLLVGVCQSVDVCKSKGLKINPFISKRSMNLHGKGCWSFSL